MRGFFVQDGRNSAGRVAHPWICLAAAGPGTAGIELIVRRKSRGISAEKGGRKSLLPPGVCGEREGDNHIGIRDGSRTDATCCGEPREGLHR